MIKSAVWLCCLLALAIPCCEAQQLGKQWIDSSEMLIGDQQRLHLISESYPTDDDFLHAIDTLPWLHILHRGQWTTNESNQFERAILFTVFDSGHYSIPALFSNTSAVSLRVNNPPDSLGQLRPIKDIEKTNLPLQKLKWALAGLIFLLFVLVLLFLLFKADKAGKSKYVRKEEQAAWQLALQALNTLEQDYARSKQVVHGQFYDRLNLILRKFLSDGCKVPALESNSNQILTFIRKERQQLKQIDMLKESFRVSDLVKFADLKTDPATDMRWLHAARSFVEENKSYSIQMAEIHRVHWRTLLGHSMAEQMEFPEEPVPAKIQLVIKNWRKTGQLKMMSGIFFAHTFELPQELVDYHMSVKGKFGHWHLALANISKNKLVNVLMVIFVLPVAAIALPVLFVASQITKDNIFGKGLFVLSKSNRLMINYQAL